MTEEFRFPGPAALVEALATHFERSLAAAIDARGAASLIVSGGRTPKALFERLSDVALDWSRITVALVDERWVAPDDPASNERLVRESLLRKRAAGARLIGMKNAAASPALGASATWAAYDAIARPYDLMLLGFGDDGHTASLFPRSPGLGAALDPNAAPGCVAMTAPVEPSARLSLNLAAVLDARAIILLATGSGKHAVYERAQGAGSEADMPMRAVLRQDKTPVAFYWAPD